MIRGDRQPVFNGEHGDFRLPLQQFREKAYMVMGQVHDNHKGAFARRRQMDEKGLQGFEASGRGADPDNGKGLAVFTAIGVLCFRRHDFPGDFSSFA